METPPFMGCVQRERRHRLTLIGRRGATAGSGSSVASCLSARFLTWSVVIQAVPMTVMPMSSSLDSRNGMQNRRRLKLRHSRALLIGDKLSN